MSALPTNERCVEHQNASFFLTLFSRNLSMSPTFSPNPQGEPNNLEISPSWAHFQWKLPNQLGLAWPTPL